MSYTYKNVIKLTAAITLLILLIGILLLIIIRNAGTWLLISDSVPKHLDLVFTFAGENVRDSYSRELMQEFPDAHWLMSDYKEGYSRILRRESFDMSRVSIVDTCSNTLSEVTTLTKWIEMGDRNVIKSKDSVLYIGLVSGPYHMRRIKMMIAKKIPQKNVRFFFLPVPLERYNWTNDMFRKWWNSPVTESVSSEIIKIAYFLLVS